jgi:hypothetical protein
VVAAVARLESRAWLAHTKRRPAPVPEAAGVNVGLLARRHARELPRRMTSRIPELAAEPTRCREGIGSVVLGSSLRIVDARAVLLRRQGYSCTGLKAILAASSAPYDWLYHFFHGSKEELGVAALRAGGVTYRELVEGFYGERFDVVVEADMSPTRVLDVAVELFSAIEGAFLLNRTICSGARSRSLVAPAGSLSQLPARRPAPPRVSAYQPDAETDRYPRNGRAAKKNNATNVVLRRPASRLDRRVGRVPRRPNVEFDVAGDSTFRALPTCRSVMLSGWRRPSF